MLLRQNDLIIKLEYLSVYGDSNSRHSRPQPHKPKENGVVLLENGTAVSHSSPSTDRCHNSSPHHHTSLVDTSFSSNLSAIAPSVVSSADSALTPSGANISNTLTPSANTSIDSASVVGSPKKVTYFGSEDSGFVSAYLLFLLFLIN